VANLGNPCGLPLPALTNDERYMNRCLQLAQLGAGRVAPNPMVGAVLVHNERIIGEGYHMQYGGPHAEVNALNSVLEIDKPLIAESTMYVSLEPCAHFGKTPPCADRIVAEGIRKVVVGCRDPFEQVDGKGIEKMQAAGVDVTVGVLQQECEKLNKRFIAFYRHHRPYIVLKWAQTADGFIAPLYQEPGSRMLISGQYANRLVHRWRSEEASILVGRQTALADDPALTVRLWTGKQPIRLVIDSNLQLPQSLQPFDGSASTVVFNLQRHSVSGSANLLEGVNYYKLAESSNMVHQVISALFKMQIQSVVVEGGRKTLQAFADVGMWDEARIITNTAMYAGSGIRAPQLQAAKLVHQQQLDNDLITYLEPALT